MISYKPLSELLAKKKVSLSDLCKEMDISESTLVCKLNNHEYISLEVIDRMCSKLGCKVENLIRWEEGEQNSSERVSVNWPVVVEKLKEADMSMNELSLKCRLDKSALGQAKLRNSQVRKWIAISMAKYLKCRVEDII